MSDNKQPEQTEFSKEDYEKQLKEKDDLIWDLNSNIRLLLRNFYYVYDNFSRELNISVDRMCLANGLDKDDEHKAIAAKAGSFPRQHVAFMKALDQYEIIVSEKNKIKNFKVLARELEGTMHSMIAELRTMNPRPSPSTTALSQAETAASDVTDE